jgi:hypothetical protein
MTTEELREKMLVLRTKIASLQWDKEHNQLNAGKATYFESIKKEFADVQLQLQSLETPEAEVLVEQKL